MDSGWICIHRKSIKSSVWKNPVTWMVWSWCLMKASHKASKFPFNGDDMELKPGQFITGRSKATTEIPITQDQWRYAISYLKVTNRISVKVTNRFSIISVIKWEDYQKLEERLPNQNKKFSPTESPASPQPVPTYNNDNNDNNTHTSVDLKKTMYNYIPCDDSGNPTKNKDSKRLTKAENDFCISLGLLWQTMCSKALSIPKEQVVMQRIYFPIRACYIKNKFKKDQFQRLFDHFLKNPSIKYEDKISFDLCLSEKYVAKYKLSQQNRNITNSEVIENIRL